MVLTVWSGSQWHILSTSVAGRAFRPALRRIRLVIDSLRVRGPFAGPTGYGHHVREFVRQLVARGVEVELEGLAQWSARRFPNGQRELWFDSLRRSVDAHIFLQFCMPHQIVDRPDLFSVNFTMFEGDRVPDLWLRRKGGLLPTIVPTESSKSAWLASGMPEELLRICPLGVDPSLYSASVEPLTVSLPHGEPISSRKTRFLNISEITPRKNIEGLLRSWLTATSQNDDAVLVMKLGGHFDSDYESVELTKAKLEAEAGRSFDTAAPIITLTDILSDAEMPRLYAACTHYISVSHGEGWDLPMMEAAASGLLLIAPDHTAYRTYLDESTATLLPSRKVPASVHGELAMLFQGVNWWEPDQDAAVGTIRSAIRGEDQAVASARDAILGRWTWEAATDQLIRILGDVDV